MDDLFESFRRHIDQCIYLDSWMKNEDNAGIRKFVYKGLFGKNAYDTKEDTYERIEIGIRSIFIDWELCTDFYILYKINLYIHNQLVRVYVVFIPKMKPHDQEKIKTSASKRGFKCLKVKLGEIMSILGEY